MPWRPPCAVGAAAATSIESALHEWREQAIAVADESVGDGLTLDALLRPCFCLFELVLAGSWLHRRQPEEVADLLASLAEAVEAAPRGTYLAAVGPSLLARVRLQEAGFALHCGDSRGALALSREAWGLLQDRRGPRDFWPMHGWELAACRRLEALALAALGELRKVQPLLAELPSLLEPAAACGARPAMFVPLLADVRALRIEAAIAVLIDPDIETWDAPAEMRQLLHDVQTLLSEDVPPHVRACMRVAAARLVVLAETPWFAAGSVRTDALDEQLSRLVLAEAELPEEAAVQKVFPVRVACLVMCGDTSAAQACAESWAARAEERFGAGSLACRSARGLAKQLAVPAPADSVAPARALQRAIREALASTGIGWLEHLVHRDGL